MFKPEMKYTNARLEAFVFGDETGVYLDESDLFDYSWETTSSQGSIVRVYREAEIKSVKLLFLNGTDPSQINRFLDIVDHDARTCQPGTLEVDGYKRRCMFTGSSADEYQWKPGLMYRETKCVMVDPDWSRSTLYTFDVREDETAGGLDYPYDYGHDYGAPAPAASVVNANASPSEFILRVYGPASNPAVRIGDNVYRVRGEVEAGGYVEINSTEKTVSILSQFGILTNAFAAASVGFRGSGEYIFEPISPGANNVSWPSSCRVDLEIIEGRSEPRRMGGW